PGGTVERTGMDENQREPDPGNAAPGAVWAVRRILPALRRGVRRRWRADLRDHGPKRAALRTVRLSRHAARAAGPRPVRWRVLRPALRPEPDPDADSRLGPQLGPIPIPTLRAAGTRCSPHHR